MVTIEGESKEPVRPSFFGAVGVAVIVLGLLFGNEWVLEFALSSDGDFAPSTRLKARLLLAAVLGGGFVLIVMRRPLDRIGARVLHRWPRLVALCFGLAFTAALLGVVEATFQTLYSKRFRASRATVTNPMMLAGTSTRAAIRVNDDTIYDVIYTFNEDMTRVTPGQPGDSSAGNILFFGGSFTFGEGVEDDETIPYYVSQSTPDVGVTNYGFSGHCTTHMLRRLVDPQTLEAHGDRKLKLVYVFIPGHVRRVIGSMRVTTAWARHFPYYAIASDGALESRGSFHKDRRLRRMAYQLLSKEAVLKYFERDYPLAITEDHLKLTAAVIEESKKTFGGEDFYVVIYPSHPKDEISGRRIIPYLEEAGIQYIDYTGLFENAEENGYWLEFDRHPTAMAHRELAEQLVADLNLADGN